MICHSVNKGKGKKDYPQRKWTKFLTSSNDESHDE